MRYIMSQLIALVRNKQKTRPKVAFSEYLYRPDEPVSGESRFKIINTARESIEDNYFMRRRARYKEEGSRKRLS